MKYLISFLLCATLHAAEPFVGTIEANSTAHGGNGKLEYLTNGKMMLIRQSGDGFRRASGLIDLAKETYTHLQHHNHSYTEVGKLSEWAKIAEDPQRPTPSRRQEEVTLTATTEKKEILGRQATKYEAKIMGQPLEIWGCEGLPTFYQWYAFCPDPRGRSLPDGDIGEICRRQKIFPLLINFKMGELRQGKPLFEVTKITPAKADDERNPALADKTYAIPADHTLMLHPMQEMKRMREQMKQQEHPQSTTK